ncbi:type II toxin-antitoxin system Y4mF family antitoxin [Massilia sp. CFBP9012]|uniref:type II toxin-antitoxin system Y4mF family antitoxin n=1 Tax=Massilia sp. CFBP9012 TaxID=3096531 RepID=UPI002A6B8D91|nr:type II toxin-antitoxin system Y4mF family antitoxin [Massilia sp. CFBP9012]MDY0978256.1 type II toxin-antitoxin system Y4mF family antitoxin [Massilia sp. CFBP9012]
METPPNTADEVSITSVRELGKLIRQTRKAQKMTQEDVSGLAGLGNRFIIDLEHGKETVQAQKVIDVLNLLGLELIIRKR